MYPAWGFCHNSDSPVAGNLYQTRRCLFYFCQPVRLSPEGKGSLFLAVLIVGPSGAGNGVHNGTAANRHFFYITPCLVYIFDGTILRIRDVLFLSFVVLGSSGGSSRPYQY
jgi:hypothetical protein